MLSRVRCPSLTRCMYDVSFILLHIFKINTMSKVEIFDYCSLLLPKTVYIVMCCTIKLYKANMLNKALFQLKLNIVLLGMKKVFY